MQPGQEPVKINIKVGEDDRSQVEKIIPVNEKFTEMKLSPNGKEFAYVFRGEIFVTSVEGGITKRITNTSWQERSVSFSPDGRSLVYAAEVDNNWNVYTASITRIVELPGTVSFGRLHCLIPQTLLRGQDGTSYRHLSYP